MSQGAREEQFRDAHSSLHEIWRKVWFMVVGNEQT